MLNENNLSFIDLEDSHIKDLALLHAYFKKHKSRKKAR